MYVRPTAQGKWRYAESYSDPLTGRKREVSVTLAKNTTAAAKEASMLLQKKIHERIAPEPDKMRLGELIKKFNAHQLAHHKESTARQDAMHLRVVERLIGPDAYVSRITTDIITSALNSTGKTNTWKNQKIRHIKLLWKWAYHQGYVDGTEVVDRLERYPEPSSRQKVLDKYMESEELKALLADMADSNTDYMQLTKMLALSGIRIGEAIALTLSDINLDSREIVVNKTYALNTGKIQSTKTETSDRIVYMRPELLEHMKAVILRQKQKQIAYSFRSDILFPWTDGGYLHYEAYSKFFREHTMKVLGHSLPVHSLRHTFTSLMAEAGVPIETISRQLGHADSQITKQIYMHVTEKVRKADNERLDAVKML